MKMMFKAAAAAFVLIGSSAAYSASCTDLARDLYTAQGYQQRCSYQLKQAPQLSAQFKAAGCDKSLSGADKNKLLNEVGSSLDKQFAASQKKSCDAGKDRFN